MKRNKAVITGSLLVFATTLAVACGDDMDMDGSNMPKKPTELNVAPVAGGAHLTWKDNSDNESGFMVERAVAAAEFQSLITVPFDTVQYHDAAVTAGTTYKYRVMAMPKEGGHSEKTEYSNEVEFVAP
jgi:hypothetical protein